MRTGLFNDIQDTEKEITEFFPFDGIVTAQFIMFQVDSFLGLGGGIHYISENDAAKLGETYSSNVKSPR